MKELLSDLWESIKVVAVALVNEKRALEMVQEHPLRES